MARFRVQGGGPLFTHSVPLLLAKVDRKLNLAMRLAGDIATKHAVTRAPQDTGVLRRSIQAAEPEGSFVAGKLSGGVVAGAPYAAAVEFGTGVHGPFGVPFEIKPKHRKVLRWEVEGGFAFAKKVMSPGAKAQPYLDPAIDDSFDAIEEVFLDALESALLDD